MYRSTKGASKARRDQINAEIRNLKELLPISEADKARLSYLHIMSLACMYTRKSVFFSQGKTRASCSEDSEGLLSFQDLSEFVQTLPGFLLVMTSEGKLLYLSENITDHLGHSMVDLVAQGDSVYDIIDPTDHFVMRSNLLPAPSADTERLFRCRFNTSRSVRRQSAGNKLVLLRGRFLQPPAGSYWSSNPVFIAFCSPLEPRPRPAPDAFFMAYYESTHGKDMAFQHASDSASFYLGYARASLLSRSWYSLLHPQDLSHASAQHCHLLAEGGEGKVETVVRLQSSDGSWVWVYSLLQLDSRDGPVTGHNYVISDSEAWGLRQQLAAEETQLALVLRASASYREALLPSPGTLSSPDTVFSPAALAVPVFEFGAVCPGEGGGAEEPMQLGGPRSSISSIEEEPTVPQNNNSAPNPAPGDVLDFFSQNCGFLPTFRADAPSLLPPPPKEFVCTPPYTPQQGGCSFMFGSPDPPTFLPSDPSTFSPSETATSELLFPLEGCGTALYEKLPPTPDSPGDGDCTVMTVPELRGPLYIEVPSVPEGLLTPEASPVKPPCASFFSCLDKERCDISRLAQQLSSLAEGLSAALLPDPLFSNKPVPPLPDAGLLVDMCQLKPWRSIDFSLLADEASLFEENMFDSLLKDLSSAPSSPSSPSPPPPPPPPPSPPTSCSNATSLDPPPHPTAKLGGQVLVRCPVPLCGGALPGSSGRPGLRPDAADPRVEAAHPSSVGGAAGGASMEAPLPPPSTDLSPEEQSFLEELASYETVFEACASSGPCEGFHDELYQLQNHMADSFHHGESHCPVLVSALSVSLSLPCPHAFLYFCATQSLDAITNLSFSLFFLVLQMGVEVILRSKISL
ncbi:neuronal PAS domain-containing protein 4A [Amia ocellicauda]|uniref:neuronal PAS domain-containing protein 4A n=1 Tax=Amia ocellicauda TaxID=2972642 RepID=UPI0034639130